MKRHRLVVFAALPLSPILLILSAWGLGVVASDVPTWLLGLLALPVLAWLAKRSIAGLPIPTQTLAMALRIVVTTAVVLGLAEVQVVNRHQEVCTLFLADVSGSIPEHVRQQELAYIRQALMDKRPEDRAGVIVFGEDASVEIPPSWQLALGELHSTVKADYTNLEQAVSLAAASFPADARCKIVLMTDGNENSGDLLAGVRRAAGNAIQVDVLPVNYQYQDEVILVDIAVPDRVQVGEPFDLRMQVRSTSVNRGMLTILRDGVVFAERRVNLKPGKNTILTRALIESTGFHSFSARISPERDQLPQNNQATGYVYVQGQARVLFICPADRDVNYLLRACQSENLEGVVSLPEGAPMALEEMQGYDCLVLANVGAEAFSTSQMEAMRSAVRDLGIGLIMIGGEHAFGMGDYRGTPIEEALPVEMDPQNKKIMPSGALILAIDVSGSMSGDKLEQAKPAARAAVETLSPKDQVGIIAFDDAPHWLIKPTAATDLSHIRNAISQLGPGGGTDIMKAVTESHRALQGIDAAVKHIIVLSDGQSGHEGFETLVQAIKHDNMTVSTVGIGERDGQPLMMELAKRGGGRFYYVRDAHQLPRIFIKEAKEVRRSLIFNQPFQPQVVMEDELLHGLSTLDIPTLMAYVATSAKPRATVPLVSSNENHDPILAYWHFGLGRSLAFTSDATTNWGQEWVSWSGFDPFWAKAIRWVSRQRSTNSLQLSTRLDGHQGKLVIDAIDDQGQFLNFLQLQGRLVNASHEGQEVAIRQTAPGRYQAEFPVDEIGVNMINVTYYDKQTGRRGFVADGLSIPYSPEFRTVDTNRALLAAAAELGGGRVLSGDAERDQVFMTQLPPVRSSHSAWAGLAVLALLLFLVDVTARRVILTRRELAGAWSRLASREAGEQDRTFEKLATRRREVSREQDSPSIILTPPVEPVFKTEPAESTKKPEPPPPTNKSGEADGYTSRLIAARRRARERDAGP